MELSPRDFQAHSAFSSFPIPPDKRANPAGRGKEEKQSGQHPLLSFQEKIQGRLDFLRKERQELLEFKVNDDKKTQELLVRPGMGWRGSLECPKKGRDGFLLPPGPSSISQSLSRARGWCWST